MQEIDSDGQLITQATLAKKLAVSKRNLQRMQASGMLPREVRLGRLVRWKLREIDDWIESGCPPPRQ